MFPYFRFVQHRTCRSAAYIAALRSNTEDGILCNETSMKHTLRKYCKLTLCSQRNTFITVRDLSLLEIEYTWLVSCCSVLV